MTVPAATTLRLTTVGLAVRDLAAASRFYAVALGLEPRGEPEPGVVRLGAAGSDLIVLLHDPGAPPAPPATGAFHVALRVPDRAELARALHRLRRAGVTVDGVADHAVSHSVYLRDPEGNGLEITVDTPRESWRVEHGELLIGTWPLDVARLLDEAPPPHRDDTIAPGTDIGHVHLHAASVPAAERWYREAMGLDLVKRFGPVASFLAADGYHHHVGCRVGAGGATPGALGLRWFAIEAEPARIGEIAARVGPTAGAPDRLLLRDPSGHAVVVAAPGTALDPWASP